MKFGLKKVVLATLLMEAESPVVTSEEMSRCPESGVFIWSSEHGENITSEISLQFYRTNIYAIVRGECSWTLHCTYIYSLYMR